MPASRGDPIDKDYWAANHPATIIKKDPSRLLGLGIYLEVGDQDLFYIDQGTEFVHRVLFDAVLSMPCRDTPPPARWAAASA